MGRRETLQGELGKAGHGLAAGSDMELVVGALNMGVDRGEADAEGIGDLFVGEAARQQPQYFPFAGGKTVRLRFFGRGLLEGADHFAGDVAGHGGTAFVDLLDGSEQFGAGGPLQHVAAGARGQGVEDMVGILINGKHQELGRRHDRFEAADAVNAALTGKVDVHQDDIGIFLRQMSDRAFHAAMFADTTVSLRLAYPTGKNLADVVVILNDRNTMLNGVLI